MEIPDCSSSYGGNASCREFALRQVYGGESYHIVTAYLEKFPPKQFRNQPDKSYTRTQIGKVKDVTEKTSSLQSAWRDK